MLRHDATFGTGNKLTADDIQLDMDNDGKVQEMTAMTHKTFDTFASDWTGCTNVAFEKVLLKFKASRSGDKVNKKNWFLYGNKVNFDAGDAGSLGRGDGGHQVRGRKGD